jgi:hypothetical protein
MWRVLAHREALSEDRRACNSSGTGVRKILRAFPQGLKPFASGLKSPIVYVNSRVRGRTTVVGSRRRTWALPRFWPGVPTQLLLRPA